MHRITTVLAIDQICFDVKVFFGYFFSYLSKCFMSVMCTVISQNPIKKRQLLIRFKSAISQFCGRFIIQYALFENISGFRGKCHEPN